MYFNLKNRIFISKLFLLFPLFLLTKIKIELYFFTFLFALLHECSHFFTALILGEKASSIFINPYGFELKIFVLEAKNELKIISGGPLFSLLMWIFFLIAENDIFAKINLIILSANLLPALPLDGGRILKIILRKKYGYVKSAAILKKTGIAVAFITALISFYCLNIWLFSVSCLIFSRNKLRKVAN